MNKCLKEFLNPMLIIILLKLIHLHEKLKENLNDLPG